MMLQIFIYILICVLVILKPTIAIVICVGMMPTFLCIILYRRPLIAYSMGCFNLCGVIPFIFQTLEKNLTVFNVIPFILGTLNLIIMYLSAGLGFWFAIMITEISSTMIDKYYKKKRAALIKEQNGLISIWGEDITKINNQN